MKWGDSIDQDELGFFVEQSDPSTPLVSTVRSIDWDVNFEQMPPPQAVAQVALERRHVYRALINLGALREDVHRELQTPREDGDMNLALRDCSIGIGPVELMHLGGEERFSLGWIEVSLSGYGSLYPWKPRDLTSRAAGLDALQPLTQICWRHFPVPDEHRVPSKQDIALRHRMGELWPYKDLGRDWDWMWGLGES